MTIKTGKCGDEQLENVHNLFASKKQISMMLAFSEGAKSLKELETITKSRAQNLLPIIGELVDRKILKKSGRGIYNATPIGEIIISKIHDFLDVFDILKKDFWITHNINVIPKHLLSGISALSGSQAIQQDATLDTSQRLATQLFKNAREKIWGISPFVTLEWAKMIIHKADNGTKISLITTEKVLRMINAVEFRDYNPLNNPNIDLWVNNNIELAYISNEEYITLALPDIEKNILDIQNILVSKNIEALRWGKKLFENFRDGSQKINS